MFGGLRLALATAAITCSSPPRSPMYPAGTDQDDGYGDLAQKSAQLLTGDGLEPTLPPPRRRLPSGDPYGGNPYGGSVYGGDPDDPDSADTGATFVPCRAGRMCYVPQLAPRTTRYAAVSGLTGAIEGTVTWRGARPAPVVTACGAVDNPGVRVGDDNAVGGVLVYIEHVELGRTMPTYARPAGVGGTIAKHGCVLAPAVQIVTPLPAGVAIHGDGTDAKLRVTAPSGVLPFELQAAGRVVLQAQPGVTRVEADDGSLGMAWVVAADTPYYAITDDAGRFRLDQLATGTYSVTFWRPPLPSLTDGKLVYGAPVITRRSVKVGPTRPARLDVALTR